jgi:hypothetical protein
LPLYGVGRAVMWVEILAVTRCTTCFNIQKVVFYPHSVLKRLSIILKINTVFLLWGWN